MNFIKYYLLISLALLLPACGPQYKQVQLKAINNATVYQTKNNVTVSAQHMNRTEITKVFGVRGRKLGYHGLCPIQLTIQNNGAETLIFDPEKTTIDYANHADVAACLKNRTVFTAGSLITLGLLATSAVYLCTLPL